MVFILEGIFKGFVQWVYSLCLEMVQYIANSLLEVFQMDLSYFRQVAPVTDDILSIVIAVGWALLLGNLVFQAMKSMVIGLGFEGEDHKLLFTRTFVFAFLLLVSQQICEIGLGISSQVIALLQVPTSVTITIPDENNFTIGASWLLIIIVGIVVMWQFVKLCFEVAERYVVTAILVLMAPLAFGMGGSKNTEDIFKGWCRMFGSMCVMMIMNVIFLKLLISALGYVPSGVAVLPWMLLIVGIARVARKIDGIIARMGLNPALTGDGLGRGLPGMVAYAVVKGIGSSIAKAAGNSVGNKSRKGGSSGGSSSEPRTNPRTPPPPPSGGSPGGAGASPGAASAGQQAGTQTDPRSPSAQGGVYASKQTVQGVSPKMDEAPPEGSHAAGVEQPAAEHKGGKTPTIHTHGARRSSVPPEARGTRASTPYTVASVRTGGVSGESSKGTLGRTAGPQDGTRRPPGTPSYDQGDSKRPDRAGVTRRSAVTPGTAAVAGPERTTHTSSTRETMRERPPLQQVYGDNVFEKDGIRRDRTGDGEKTRCLCGKRGIFNWDGPAMGPQIIRQLERRASRRSASFFHALASPGRPRNGGGASGAYQPAEGRKTLIQGRFRAQEGPLGPSRKSQQQTKRTGFAALEDSIADEAPEGKRAKRANRALNRAGINSRGQKQGFGGADRLGGRVTSR